MRKIFTALFTIFVLQCSAHAADKIRIGVPAIVVQFASLPLGAKRGFFQDAGLQAEFIQMSPTVAMAALLSGGIDYLTSFGGPVAGAIRGAPIKIVACYVPRNAHFPYFPA